MDMPLVPAIPYDHGTPVTGPVHLEKVQAALFEYFHAVGFDLYLGVVVLGPFAQLIFCVSISDYHEIQGLGCPEITDSHLV